MSNKLILWLSSMYVVCLVFSLIIDGGFLSSNPLETIFATGDPIGNVAKIVTWDYSFLQGNFQILKWIMWGYSIVCVYAAWKYFRGISSE